MGYDGSGNFVRNQDFTADRAAGKPRSKISSAKVDDEFDNLTTGLSSAITKDGQTTITADLPMASHKHTNVGEATARNQYAAVSQVQDGSLNYQADTGTANAYAVALSPAATAYVQGQVVHFKPANANTGASTLALNGMSTKAIKKGGSAALDAGDIVANQIVTVIYDGTNFQMTNSASGVVALEDADGDTSVTVEASSDEDRVRITAGGTEIANYSSSGMMLGTDNSPYDMLHIKSASDVAARIESTGGVSSLHLRRGALDWLLKNASNGLEFEYETTAVARVGTSGQFLMKEQSAPSSTSGYGTLYVSSSDNALHFIDDTGTDTNISGGGLSGDYQMELLSSGTTTSASYTTVTGMDNAEYDEYMILLDEVHLDTNNKQLCAQLSVSGTFETGGSDYSWASSNYNSAGSSTGDSKILLDRDGKNGADSAYRGAYRVYIHSPKATSFRSVVEAIGYNYDDSSHVPAGGQSNGNLNATSAIDGIRFFSTSGNHDLKFKLYGIRFEGS